MPRVAITADVFSAIAEPRRRQILDLLAKGGDRPVGEIVRAMRLPQPAVSKHLGVLRSVGVVAVNRRGRERLYRLSAESLRPVHEWVKAYERFWSHQLQRVRERAEARAGHGASRSTAPEE